MPMLEVHRATSPPAASPVVRSKMTETWHSLLANLAIVAIVVSIWTQLDDPADGPRRLWRTLWLALLLAGGTVAVMALPFEIIPGVFADLRVTMIALSAFFGGPLVGAVAWLAGVAYRLWVGGVGTPPPRSA
jgi:5TMR of 5TMR-LYT